MKAYRSTGKWLGLGVAACAACCAVPIAALFGIGGATAAVGAMFADVNLEMLLCLGLLGTFIAGIYFWMRSRRMRSVYESCSTACNTDASCCNPPTKSDS
jgi:membrane protein implicated in regulation of membrane protease activity